MSDLNKFLEDLAKKLIRLNGNDLVNKRIGGGGSGQIFNVFDEIPEFILRDLIEDKNPPNKFKIGALKEDEGYLDDETKKSFKEKYKSILESKGIDNEEDIDDDEIRYLKDKTRIELDLPPREELVPDHDVILPEVPAGDSAAKYLDKTIQSDVPDIRYNNILKGIVNRRNEYLREKGLDTLYLTFGLLEWTYQADNHSPPKLFNSPILLLKVTLEEHKKHYKIYSENKEIFFNNHLLHALKTNLKTSPPSLNFPEDADHEMIANICGEYLKTLQSFLSGGNLTNPIVHRRIACGIFKSTGIPPEELNFEDYEDEDKVRLFKWLAGEEGAPKKLENYALDNTEYRNLVPALSLPADSSQHSAVADAANGDSFYIEGPPGTGKSQTILNIISNCLYHGKKVLFLAQKTAALKVVYERLKTIKINNKCIPLHSEHTIKSKLYDNFNAYIQKHGNSRALKKELNESIRKRDNVIDKLNKYSNFLKINLTDNSDKEYFNNQEIVTEYALIRDKVVEEGDFIIKKVFTKSEYQEIKKELEEIKLDVNPDILSNYEELQSYISNDPISTFDISEFNNTLKVLLDLLVNIPEHFSNFNQDGFCNESKRVKSAIPPLEDYNKTVNRINELFDNAEGIIPREISQDNKLLTNASFFAWLFNKDVKLCFNKYLKISTRNITKRKIILKDIDILEALIKKKNALKEDLNALNINDYSNDYWKNYYSEIKAWVETNNEISTFASKYGIDLVDMSLCQRKISLELISKNSNNLNNLALINNKITKLKQKVDCSNFLYHIIYSGKDIVEQFHNRYLHESTRQVAQKYPILETVEKKHIELARSELKELDKEVTYKYNKYIRSILVNLNNLPGEIGKGKVKDKQGFELIKYLAKVPNSRVTLRELMLRSGKVLNEITPCFLMTPSSVADLLPKDHKFDVCIIDEASQMLVEEAAGSLLRSKQIIVVGDQKQMPPTRYMVSTLQQDDDDDEGAKKDESILDKCAASLGKMRRLQYHYRSEDQSLISFSNNKFYDNDLMIPPTSMIDKELGVKLIEVNDAIYNPGGQNSIGSKNPNPIEAEKIVELILNEIQKHPKRSMGVALLNLRQTTRVFEIFDEKRANHSYISDYVESFKNKQEYFFIKNLENVQGDERDTIIIGTVFGKTKEGKNPNYFGPINQEMGENRINVLITRAKKKVIVCSSLKPQNITSKKIGPQILKDYLIYAKEGKIQEAIIPDEEAYDSPWEKWFKERLETDGYNVVPQVGVSNFKIDLGVQHKDFPGGFLCGIELDGWKYHSEESARERDHHRQSILELKGWTIFRVWSTDFFADKEGVYQTLKTQIDQFLRLEIKRIQNN